MGEMGTAGTYMMKIHTPQVVLISSGFRLSMHG